LFRVQEADLMTVHPPDEERQWAAEKRDFVADRRDELAAERDAAGDARDRTADARESTLDQRERELDARAAEFGPSRVGAETAAQRVDARAAREQARNDREWLAAERDAAAGTRHEATKRRLEATPTTRLASAFAAIAENLYAADSFDAVLLRIAETAVSTVAGCHMASVTLSKQGTYQTAATTDSAASAVDEMQYDAREGPCLDAVDAPMVYAQSFPDSRWPKLAARPADLGVQSAASYRLAATSLQTAGTGGSLNTYGAEPDAFSEEAKEIGLILAAHASMAAGAVRERGALRDLDENLNKALLSRDVIGQAKGILMERLKITPEDAFDVLRRSSQRLNEKLHAVAQRLAETGDFDTTDIHRTDGHPTRRVGVPDATAVRAPE
jgi:ANTAR domain